LSRNAIVSPTVQCGSENSRRYARLVAFGTRIAVTLVTAAVAVLPMACGGDDVVTRARCAPR